MHRCICYYSKYWWVFQRIFFGVIKSNCAFRNWPKGITSEWKILEIIPFLILMNQYQHSQKTSYFNGGDRCAFIIVHTIQYGIDHRYPWMYSTGILEYTKSNRSKSAKMCIRDRYSSICSTRTYAVWRKPNIPTPITKNIIPISFFCWSSICLI